MALERQNKIDEAETSFRQFLALRPKSPVVHYELGKFLARQNKLQEAADQFREALALNPNHGESRSQLDAVLAKQKT
jgi:Flp pilus assembly protein TadD